MNANREVNYHILKLIQDLQQKFSTLTNNNNRTKPPNPKSTCKPPNSPNPWNWCRCNTSKYCWLCGACSHTSMDFNMKNNGHKEEATFCGKMEGSDNYCHTTAELRGGAEIEIEKIHDGYRYLLNLKNIQWTIFKILKYHHQPLKSYLKVVVLHSTTILPSDTFKHYKMLWQTFFSQQLFYPIHLHSHKMQPDNFHYQHHSAIWKIKQQCLTTYNTV